MPTLHPHLKVKYGCWLLAFWMMLASYAQADVIISEVMASNRSTLADEDGAYSDWIELHNPSAQAVDLNGWYLTDSASTLTKWPLPAVTLDGGAYLVVFASNKNRRTPGANLHTNFALSAGGEYLGLTKPDGVSVAFEFTPGFPALADDVSYGVVIAKDGSISRANTFVTPTPGAVNSALDPIPLENTVSFSRAGGPFRIAFTLVLSGVSTDQEIRYVVARGLGANAAPEPTRTSPVYSGPISIDASSIVRAAVFSTSGDMRGPAETHYYSRVANDITSFSSQLPIFVIDSQGSGSLTQDGIDHASSLYVYQPRSDGRPVFANQPDLVTPLTASVRGSSSADFPKKGYNIRLTDAAGKRQAQPLLDLPAYDRWALVAPWSFDLGYVNNAFVYSLSNQMGRWAPRTRLVEVFFNATGDAVDASDYAGIYVTTDRIEVAAGRVPIAALSPYSVSGPALTGGYIIKIDPKDSDEIGWLTNGGFPNDGSASIILVSPKADEVAPAQLNYIKDYVQGMENALIADRSTRFAERSYLDFIDRASWVDHHILNVFTANPDALTRSAYFTKDRGGKLTAGPVWDFDRALGSYWDERSWRWDLWSGLGTPDPWRVGWWGIIAEDPEFMQDWIDRWHALRKNELSARNLVSLITPLAASVGADAARRDAARWPDNTIPSGSYDAQIEHMKLWVTNRAQWIDQQFLAPPKVTQSGSSLVFTALAGVQMVYTLDGSDPRSMGGDIAPNAELTSTPLSVPAGANVHVRSYRADLRDVFPGSPWSAAVGGEASSPLSPKARLANISTRALVGAGENALIAGVVVADTAAKRYLSRAIGPGLAAFGASGLVPDPQLSIFAGNGAEIFRNNGWETGTDATELPFYSRNAGAFPLTKGSKDAALANHLSSGSYTVQVTTPSGRGGIGLVELYELDGNGRTVNLSSRASVRTGDGVLIGGFVVSGPAYQRMLIRAVGPTLQAFGLTTALADPVLTLYSGAQIIATNDRWETGEKPEALAATTKRVGAFNLTPGSEDAALLVTLPPGAYTVEVKGKNGEEGIALLEVYAIP